MFSTSDGKVAVRNVYRELNHQVGFTLWHERIQNKKVESWCNNNSCVVVSTAQARVNDMFLQPLAVVFGPLDIPSAFLSGRISLYCNIFPPWPILSHACDQKYEKLWNTNALQVYCFVLCTWFFFIYFFEVYQVKFLLCWQYLFRVRGQIQNHFFPITQFYLTNCEFKKS